MPQVDLLSNKYKRVVCKDIVIKRSDRQRRDIDTTDIDDSIRQRGVLVPIILNDHDPDFPGKLVLVAGERRLTSCLKQGIETVPVRLTGELTSEELQIVELEENVKRQDLPWRDQVTAIGRLHDLYVQTHGEEGWTQAKTAKELAVKDGFISKVLRIYRDINSPRLSQATGIMQAHNILSRIDDRAASDAINNILDAAEEVVDRGEKKAVENSAAQKTAAKEGKPLAPGQKPVHYSAVELPPLPVLPPAPESVLQSDFITWVEGYSGPKFNLVHCDFPYGVNVFKGEQAGKRMWQEEGRQADIYSDDPNVYWQLCRAFCKHLDKFMAQSSHLLFWFGMDTYTETLAFFEEHAPSLHFNKKPLIWMKSDNAGILADPKRGPRNIYEVALMASRGDRLVVKATSNAYACHTDKEYHPSTKPEPMLKYFFQMFVDENTKMLDPTCGGGSSLRAAEALGAKEVLGLEIDPTFVVSARAALKKSRTLRKMSTKAKGMG